MIFVTMLGMFLVAAAVAWTASIEARQKEKASVFHTFIVDPLTFLLLGIVSVVAVFWKRKGRPRLTWGRFRRRKRIVDLGLLIFLVAFWTAEILTYFNVISHPFDPTKTGNDFMWNGYVEWIFGPVVDTTIPTFMSPGMNLLALVLLVSQLLLLRLGRLIGYTTAYFNDPDNWSRPS
jgi:hypothetical protein